MQIWGPLVPWHSCSVLFRRDRGVRAGNPGAPVRKKTSTIKITAWKNCLRLQVTGQLPPIKLSLICFLRVTVQSRVGVPTLLNTKVLKKMKSFQ